MDLRMAWEDMESLDALRVWIISLITISIICSLLEKLAPEGNLNKYVRLVCGLVVAAAMAGPLIRLFGGDFKIQEVSWHDYLILSEGEMERRIQRLEKEEADQLLEIYRQTLISDVKYHYQGEKDFAVTAVDVVLQENSQNSDYGAVRELYIKVGPRPNNESAAFSNLMESRMKTELSQALEIDAERIIVDSSNFEGR